MLIGLLLIFMIIGLMVAALSDKRQMLRIVCTVIVVFLATMAGKTYEQQQTAQRTEKEITSLMNVMRQIDRAKCGYYRVVEGAEIGDLIHYGDEPRLYQVINVDGKAVEWTMSPKAPSQTVSFYDLCTASPGRRIGARSPEFPAALAAWRQQ